MFNYFLVFNLCGFTKRRIYYTVQGLMHALNKERKLTLLPEEKGAAIVVSEENNLALLQSNIHNWSLRETTSQVLSLDREEPVGSQVSEIQHWRTATLLHQRWVENVSPLDTGGNCVREDHSESFIRGDIVNDNGSGGCVGHVHVYLAVVRVVDRQILQTRQLIHQVTQIDHLHDLRDTVSQRESFILRPINFYILQNIMNFNEIEMIFADVKYLWFKKKLLKSELYNLYNLKRFFYLSYQGLKLIN